jgi:hypothetical protein
MYIGETMSQIDVPSTNSRLWNADVKTIRKIKLLSVHRTCNTNTNLCVDLKDSSAYRLAEEATSNISTLKICQGELIGAEYGYIQHKVLSSTKQPTDR